MMRRILAASALVAVCVVLIPLCLGWMWLALVMGSPRGPRLALGWDQLANVMAGGDEDESISSRCWRYRADVPYCWLQPAIDWVALQAFGDTDHCRRAALSEISRIKR